MSYKSLLIAAFLLLFSFGLSAASPESRLQGYLSELQSLEAEFDQKILDASGQRLQQTEGEMRLLKPGRFHWETRKPFPEVLVSDGQTLWLYDPGLEQVTVQQLDQRMAHTPALILSGETADLTEDFQVDYQKNSDEEVFTLVPRAGDSLFEKLQLFFQQGQITAISLEDSLGQQTRVDLINPRYNQPLSPSGFDFVIPDDIDVIQE
ncbi:outer membrane lipoprotein chaperone LolA [Marinospirillum sp.]|uniref:outer membrane lipoprotein chaperone LolA n=1 Tax=Marinospirillum sp. TaxID=2183934 RepID=UPI00384D78BC